MESRPGSRWWELGRVQKPEMWSGQKARGDNLFSLASGGAIYVQDPHRLVSEDQLNGGQLMRFTKEDWALIHPYLEENERQFGIRVEVLLTVVGEVRRPQEVYRKVGAVQLTARSW